MTSTTSVQPPTSERDSCRILPTVQENKLRPKLPLLRILQEAGAHEQSFTLKEVMHYLGQYIMIKQLYDEEEQHIVRCGQDELGVLLGVQSFSVKDPSPLYDMLKRSLLPSSFQDAAKTLTVARNQSTELLRQDQPQSSAVTNFDASGVADSAALLKRRHSQEDILVEEDTMPPPYKQPKLELVFEEWDVAGLPWWFIGNLRNNYDPLSNGSTDIPTNQDIDTAVVSDTTDDLWFMNEAGSEQHSVEAKVETQDSDHGSDVDHGGEESKTSDKEVLDATFEDLEDSQCLSDDTDTDYTSEDCWQCTKCKKFNSPIKRYCFRCWALRKDWYIDCPKLAHSLSLSTSNISSKLGGKDSDKGIDIPDCRRTISAPVVRPRDLQPLGERSRLLSGGTESLDLARPACTSLGTSESQSRLLTLSQKSEEQQKEEAPVKLDSSKPVLEPCLLCQRKPRNGSIIHGRTAHLVACFLCANNLHRAGLPCPVCKKKINMVIKTFVG